MNLFSNLPSSIDLVVTGKITSGVTLLHLLREQGPRQILYIDGSITYFATTKKAVLLQDAVKMFGKME